MYLTKWEEKALNGEFGEALAKAMKIIVSVGEALDAERLVEISHAHVSGISIDNIGLHGVEVLENFAKMGAHVRVYTTANPCSAALYMDNDVGMAQRRIVEALRSMGIDVENSLTCAPYLVRKPSYGEHLAWAESSAVIIANSLYGAKTNREGGIVALAAAIAGRTYEAGLHLDEERRPHELVCVKQEIKSVFEASILGLAIGAKGVTLPLIDANVVCRLRITAIKNMLASIASTSSCGMAIIKGFSPYKIDETSIHELERIDVDSYELRMVCEDVCNTILVGCPHLPEDEVAELLLEIVASPIAKHVDKVVVTCGNRFRVSQNLQHAIDKLRRLGIEVDIIRGVCLVVSKSSGIRCVSTPHGKALYYIPKLLRACVYPVNI